MAETISDSCLIPRIFSWNRRRENFLIGYNQRCNPGAAMPRAWAHGSGWLQRRRGGDGVQPTTAGGCWRPGVTRRVCAGVGEASLFLNPGWAADR
jgi:hypothetical protein